MSAACPTGLPYSPRRRSARCPPLRPTRQPGPSAQHVRAGRADDDTDAGGGVAQAAVRRGRPGPACG